MKAIITEKPSVAADIARVLGITQKQNGYFEGNNYLITWAYGHLVGLALPDEYGWSKFKAEDLPLIPEPFRLSVKQVKTKTGYKADSHAKRQLEIIREVFSRSESIIVATDAGREGELIFRWIYHYLKCRKPFERLWISSLTDKAIQEGLHKLRKGKEYDGLYLAAEARSQADWLVGINASRALCLASSDHNNSLGRVQTPTLAMICDRYQQYRNFTPEKYWQVCLHCEKDQQHFLIRSKDVYHKESLAEKAYRHGKKYTTGTVTNILQNEEVHYPPLLHDLTSLQQEANKRLGLSAEKTLSVAQKLYERKYITYPRTGSRYITKDVYEEIPQLLTFLGTYPAFSLYVSALLRKKLYKKAVNDKKVTDHHALLVTGILPEHLSSVEKNVYNLIAGRMLEAFSPSHVRVVTTVEINVGSMLYTAKGMKVKENGWKDLFSPEEEGKDEFQSLPHFRKEEEIRVESHNLIQKVTHPKPLFTEATLLGAMETAGKDIEETKARNAMKGMGLGTPATRAGIIETLIEREYIQRSGKLLLPTKKGMSLYYSVRSMRIADVELTGSWESALKNIEQDPGFYQTFMRSLQIHVRQITDEIISIRLPQVELAEPVHVCPKCRLGKVSFLSKIARCTNSACNLTIYRNQGNIFLSDEELTELIQKKKTSVLFGIADDGKTHANIHLGFDKDFNLVFTYPDRGEGQNS